MYEDISLLIDIHTISLRPRSIKKHKYNRCRHPLRRKILEEKSPAAMFGLRLILIALSATEWRFRSPDQRHRSCKRGIEVPIRDRNKQEKLYQDSEIPCLILLGRVCLFCYVFFARQSQRVLCNPLKTDVPEYG